MYDKEVETTYCIVIKHNGNSTTLEKCTQQEPDASAVYISRLLSYLKSSRFSVKNFSASQTTTVLPSRNVGLLIYSVYFNFPLD